MRPHLHPRSRSTTSLFAATLLASFFVVGVPHIFPCPAPRRTLADSEMMITADGRQVPRVRRKRRASEDAPDQLGSIAGPTPQVVDEEVSTFLQMEEEAERMAKVGRECPVPKPGGIIGEILGFRNARNNDEQPEGSRLPRSEIPAPENEH
ncbi:hypothetical protein VTN02DRAFT_5814 [Thermoascus thermophilus]